MRTLIASVILSLVLVYLPRFGVTIEVCVPGPYTTLAAQLTLERPAALAGRPTCQVDSWPTPSITL